LAGNRWKPPASGRMGLRDQAGSVRTGGGPNVHPGAEPLPIRPVNPSRGLHLFLVEFAAGPQEPRSKGRGFVMQTPSKALHSSKRGDTSAGKLVARFSRDTP
jgi:hypothetical protein